MPDPTLCNVASVTFGGRDLKTVYLGRHQDGGATGVEL